MKKIAITLILLCVCGCSFDLMTKDNPMGFVDPNQAGEYFKAGLHSARAAQAIGTATGNPVLIGGGILAGIILTTLGSSYIKGKKK